MKTRLVCGLVSACLLACAGFAADKEKNRGHEHEQAQGDTRKVAFLGVVTEQVDPQLARHLKLRPGEGLVVTMVDDSSPAAGIIKEDDVLKELNGQWLVNPEQLRAVVRLFQPGDEVNLSLIRDGEAKKVSVKLGEREISLREEAQAQLMGRGGMMGGPGMMSQDELMELMRNMQRNQPRFHQRMQVPQAEDDDADAKVETHTSVSSSTTISKDGNTITLTDNNGEKRLKVIKGGEGNLRRAGVNGCAGAEAGPGNPKVL
jgi:hypothetical protein